MKTKKFHLFIFTLFLLFGLNMMADQYRILFVNSSNLTINGKKAEKGMLFKDTDNISWSNPKQSMRVRNIDTHKTFTIYPSQFEKGKPSTIQQLFISKRLSTREWGIENNILETPVVMLDTLELPAGKNFDRTFHFLIIKKENSEAWPLVKSSDGNTILIPRNIFKDFDTEPVIVDIISKENDLFYPLYEDIKIEFLNLSDN